MKTGSPACAGMRVPGAEMQIGIVPAFKMCTHHVDREGSSEYYLEMIVRFNKRPRT